MRRDEWWKSFAIGIELDASGAFIYNGIKFLDVVEEFYHPVDVFEILYNLSVGIERLLKVAIVLMEHNDRIPIKEFEKSLITHNAQVLLQRLNHHKHLHLLDIHREFLAILAKFYKSYRYGRFSLSSVPNIDAEQTAFLYFIKKHLKLDIDINVESAPVDNTDQIRKFIGKIVKHITDAVFNVIRGRAMQLNIYTDELRGDSKALKVFYGDRLDFIDERRKKKEILLYLMDPRTKGDHIGILRSYGSLRLDPEMAPSHIKVLLNDAYLPFVAGEIEELYRKIPNVRERLDFLEVIDNEYLSYDPEKES